MYTVQQHHTVTNKNIGKFGRDLVQSDLQKYLIIQYVYEAFLHI